MNNNYINPDNLINRKLKIQIVVCDIVLEPYAQYLCEVLEKNNIEAELDKDIDCGKESDIVIVINPTTNSFKKDIKKLFYSKNKKIVCAILTEQPYGREIGYINTGKGMVHREKKWLKKFNIIFTWSIEQRELYKKFHHNVQLFPYSYIQAMDYKKKYENNPQKYDLLFLGHVYSKHRNTLVHELEKKYNICYDEFYGEEKYKVINESKICLNLHQETSLVFEAPRFYDYVSNGAFVLSEPMKNTFPYERGKDYDVFYPFDMFEKIDYYLEHEDKRNKIANNAYEKAKKDSMEQNVYILIDAVLMEEYYLWNKSFDGKISYFGRKAKHRLHTIYQKTFKQ